MIYINGKSRYDGGAVETIDEFKTRKEAFKMIQEYRVAFGPCYELWMSQRSTKEWRESKNQ